MLVISVNSGCDMSSDDPALEHVVVASEEGRFFAWPANNGLWSWDNGRTWSFLSKAGATGLHNGNPPGLALLEDGRLACSYANRDLQQMLVRFSSDNGKT